MDLQFDGIEKLSQKLKAMQKFEGVEKKALTESGEYFKGKLEESVYKYGLKRKSSLMEKSVVITEVVNGQIKIGISNQNNDAFYAFFHEWSTVNMPARPFLRPTFYKEVENLKRIIAEELKKGLGL